ncbi:MAG: M15 family metallopeptidase [Microbacteriaceae bacterium]
MAAAGVLAVTVIGVTSAPGPTPGTASGPPSAVTPAPTTTTPGSAAPSPAPPVFDKAARSIDDPASIWVVVNKRRPLNPLDYAPADLVFPDVPDVDRQPLRQEAANAITAMFAAGGTETGLAFQVQSAYRDYGTQVNVHNGWVDRLGQAAADRTSARPGVSEHQTGLAVDISSVPAVCPLQICFAETGQAVWLAANAWRFGFILRYPADKTAITGYEFEPYHFRYVGPELAAELHAAGVTTLEEFFGLPPAPEYG